MRPPGRRATAARRLQGTAWPGAAWLLALVALVGGSCRFDATEVLVVLDTDAPADHAMTLTATLQRPDSAGGAVQVWERGPDAPDGGLVLPASFAVVPSADGTSDEAVTLVLDVAIAGGTDLLPPATFRRVARFGFTSHETTTLRLFLALRCGEAATGCVFSPCTRSVLCEEQGLTCGDYGECVVPDVRPGTGGFDAGPPPADLGPTTVVDVADDLDAPDDLDATAAPDAAPSDEDTAPVDMGLPVIVPPDLCPGACAGRTCGPNRCGMGSCGECGGGAFCQEGSCAPCGAAGQPCCPGASCGAALACLNGQCVCGLLGIACCAGGGCLGSACQGGRCVACGSGGQPCCAGSACAGGYACFNNQCVCGLVGISCCPGGGCLGSVCRGGRCAACGGRGEPCCAGNGCSSPYACAGGTCACGALNEPCCPGGGCNGGAMCQGGRCVAACHGEGASCAAGQSCCGPFVCGSTTLGRICCGNRDAPCHSSTQCCGSGWCCNIGGGVMRCRNGGTCG